MKYQWDFKGRPFFFQRRWRQVAPIRGMELRDSLRAALEQRGGTYIDKPTYPFTWPGDTTNAALKMCVDSAAISLVEQRQPGQRFEGQLFVATATVDPDCSPTIFARWRRRYVAHPK